MPNSIASPARVATVPAASTGWLDRLNQWRQTAGLSNLTENSTYSSGDAAHSLYMVKNDQVTHYETPGLPYYTADGDLAAHDGNIEADSSTSFTDEQAIDWWMEAPFHAMGMMDPRLQQTGFGSYREVKSGWEAGFTLDVIRGNSFTGGNFPVYWPGNNVTEPLTTYNGGESPDPLQACPGYAAPTGLPVFIELGGNVSTTAGPVHSFTGNGVPLAHCVIDSTNSAVGGDLTDRGGVIVVPEQPLQSGVKYVVALTVNGAPYTWSFTVGPLSGPCTLGGGSPVVGALQPSAGPASGSTTVNISGCGFTGATAVNFGGAAAGHFSVVSDSLITATSPAHAPGAVDVTVTTPLGTSATGTQDQFAFAPYTQYFQWFDLATPGMVGDNIHLLNTSSATANIEVTLAGASTINVSLAAGAETHVSFGRGHMGGPVVVNSDQPILASQRVQYYQSFNEVWGMSAAQAATTSYINWFDKASPGMVGDNIHVLNPGGTVANVTVSLAGASPIVFAVQPGQETYVSFPAGKIGGPVKIVADQPVLASQRVQYYQSFNEVVARSAAQASTASYFNWFDRATSGMVADNIHILNPGATTANITVTLAGASPIVFALQAGQETYVTFLPGHIGGPVSVTSDQPVLASQRVQYYQSFNEVASDTASQALATSYIMWFDRATNGMVADNIHVLNPGATAASITVSLPGASSVVFTLAAGRETYVSFPVGRLGGPVTITSSVPVLAAQRVQYYQSFNEVPAA
jgi:IPT/TIG domain-containing protein/cysteine-rich secretory family protein